MDYHDMSRDELIKYIEKLKEERAFSEEDRYLLKILDNSPFTIWASDRNCIIRFWAGQCESLYGYKKDKAINKDFVELFVADDEKKAAREDQIKIIDSGEVFHNIANDHAKNGNTLRLLTNCWRMKAPNSDEYWNIEMGLIVDFFYQEMERLEEIISESRLYKARITQFEELIKQVRRQYNERKKIFHSAIRDTRRQALIAKKAKELTKSIEPIQKTLDELDEKLYKLIDDYLHLVQGSGTSAHCEELTDEFKEKYDELFGEFDDALIDLQEVAYEFTPDAIILGKDSVLKESAVEFEKHYDRAYNLKIEINKKVDSIKAQITLKKDSKILSYYTNLLTQIESVISSLRKIQNNVFDLIGKVQNYDSVKEVRASMQEKYLEIDSNLSKIDEAFKQHGVL